MIIKRIFKNRLPQSLARRLREVLHLHPRLFLCLAGLGLLSVLIGAVWVRNQAWRSLADERARQARQEFIPFEKSRRTTLSRPEIKFWQNIENTRSVIRFQDSYFAATDGGLVQFSTDGNL